MSVIRCPGIPGRLAHNVDEDFEDTAEHKGEIYCLTCFAELEDKPIIDRYAIRKAKKGVKK